MASVYQQYERSFTSFGGPDIVPIFNNKVIGECQALTYSVRREKARRMYSSLKRVARRLFTNTIRLAGPSKTQLKSGKPHRVYMMARAIPRVMPVATPESRRDSETVSLRWHSGVSFVKRNTLRPDNSGMG